MEFIPRTQDDRIQLAVLEELRKLNSNIEKIMKAQTPIQEQTITVSSESPKKPSGKKKEVKKDV
jgi:hypothetical protein